MTMKKNVLICDNDTDMLELVTIILSGHGFNVFTCETCEEVLQKIRDHQPDLILMDIWVPIMGGERATQLLKKSPQHAHIPIIMLSANNEVKKIAQRSGADDFVAKPFEIDQLVNKIKKHLYQSSTKVT